MQMNLDPLNVEQVKDIKKKVIEKQIEYFKQQDIIGGKIFNILEKESKVLYYPLEDQEVWGFSEKIGDRFFVGINTAISYDKQVFAAAHELYHIWFVFSGSEIMSDKIYENITNSEVEQKANRFAAEFLVNDELLCKEMDIYQINKETISVKEIVMLATLFTVPYKTMVKRLYEINVYSADKFNLFMQYTNQDVTIWRDRLGLSLPVREKKIGLSDLVDKTISLYEKNLITYEKLNYLLEMADLTPEKMGIKTKPTYVPPSEEELDGIMEDD